MKKIAVIEDNADNRMLVQALLADSFQLDEYENGLEALAGMHEKIPDVVLLDISLPGIDGSEVLKRMRLSPFLRSVPVIALTANAAGSARSQFLSEGFDDFIPKPIVHEHVLMESISRLMRDQSQST